MHHPSVRLEGPPHPSRKGIAGLGCGCGLGVRPRTYVRMHAQTWSFDASTCSPSPLLLKEGEGTREGGQTIEPSSAQALMEGRPCGCYRPSKGSSSSGFAARAPDGYCDTTTAVLGNQLSTEHRSVEFERDRDRKWLKVGNAFVCATYFSINASKYVSCDDQPTTSSSSNHPPSSIFTRSMPRLIE